MYKNQSTASIVLSYIILLILLIISGFPLFCAFTGSFKSSVEFLSNSGGLLPKVWRWENYAEAWNTAHFGKYTLNSVIISVTSVIGTTLTCSMAGYVLARGKFKEKKLLIVLFIVTMFSSGTVTLFPIYMICKNLGLTSSLWGIIIAEVAISQPLYSIIVMGYVKGISHEIDESAKLDGCNFFRIYWNIIMPIIKPILATVSILQFRDAWNSYMLPLAFTLSNSKLRPLTVGVVALKDQGLGISAWNLMIAGTVMSLFPIIIVYLFLNKYFIAGITEGALKE
jgi:multiple sugar transport system permease protein